MKQLIIPSILLLNFSLAHAATPGAYLGLGGGLGSIQEQFDFIKDTETSLAGRLFAGYNFNQYLGVEAGYTAIGTNRYWVTDVRGLGVDLSLNAASLVGKAYLPLADNSANIYALLGAAQVYAGYKTFYANQTWPTLSQSGAVLTGGLGVNFEITPSLNLGIEVSAFDKKTRHNEEIIPASSIATLSLAYKL